MLGNNPSISTSQTESQGEPQMSFERLEGQISTLEKVVSDLNVKIPPNSVMQTQVNTVKEFLEDKGNFSLDEVDVEWGRRFKDFYDSQLAVSMLADAVSVLADRQPGPEFTKTLKRVFSGAITQGGDPSNARDSYYELWIASLLAVAGFDVLLDEPDVVISGKGLNDPVGVACKYPSSIERIYPSITKGYSQLKSHGLQGFVSIGIDQLVMFVTKLNEKNYLDFRQSDREPQELLQSIANGFASGVISEYGEKFPSEDPVTHLFVTASFGGFYGDPPGFCMVGAATMGISPLVSPLPDILTVTQALATSPELNRNGTAGHS